MNDSFSILAQLTAISGTTLPPNKSFLVKETSHHKRAGSCLTPAKAKAIAELHERRYQERLVIYKAVMQGAGWMRGSDIERIMSLKHGGARKFLKKMLLRGEVEMEERLLIMTRLNKMTMFWKLKDDDMKHGTYVGDKEVLKGKTALIKELGETEFSVQFDDISLSEGARRYGYGWWAFPKSDFVLDKEHEEASN